MQVSCTLRFDCVHWKSHRQARRVGGRSRVGRLVRRVVSLANVSLAIAALTALTTPRAWAQAAADIKFASSQTLAASPAMSGSRSPGPLQHLDELVLFAGLDGSKQPQDYGVNANLGPRLHVNWGVPLSTDHGLGLQVGSAVEWSDNAVQVYELLGERTTRFQNFVTLGLFQRTPSGLAWGVVYDHLHQRSFSTVDLGQVRGRLSYRFNECTEFGITGQVRTFGDTASFLGTPVRLRPITQGSLYARRWFESGVQVTLWAGMSGAHGESNAVTGPAPAKDAAFLMGADLLAPLNDHFAIYGETNLIMPADTGTVDAYLGLAWYPRGGARCARSRRYSPLLPVAADTSFSTDLLP